MTATTQRKVTNKKSNKPTPQNTNAVKKSWQRAHQLIQLTKNSKNHHTTKGPSQARTFLKNNPKYNNTLDKIQINPKHPKQNLLSTWETYENELTPKPKMPPRRTMTHRVPLVGVGRGGTFLNVLINPQALIDLKKLQTHHKLTNEQLQEHLNLLTKIQNLT